MTKWLLKIGEQGNLLAWVVSVLALLGSLYYSNIMLLPPCVLCWYQRIAMYPLVVILGVGIWRNEKKLWQYALPLAAIGGLIAVYHNLLYYNILPESVAPCMNGVSCTTRYYELFGLLTIPMQALLGFLAIAVFLSLNIYSEKHAKRN